MKRLAIALVGALALTASVTMSAQAAAPNITGNWKVEQSGYNGPSSTTLKLQQSGDNIVGTSSSGNNFQGKFVNDTQIDATWHGPGGSGWLTVYVTPNGHSFNGQWGYHGRGPNGTFVGNKFLPPSPITAKGTWNLTLAGGPELVSGTLTCTESGKAAVCHAGPVTIDGRFRADDKIRATWKNSATGKTGWFSMWFNGDNNSFNGIWGYGAETTPPVGRIVGQRSLTQ